mgnify:CR=1 FL=1
MRWREITKQEVEKTIEEPEQREAIGINRFHLFKHFGVRFVRVTCVIEASKCIVISAVNKMD